MMCPHCRNYTDTPMHDYGCEYGSGRRKENKKMELTWTATMTGEGAFPSAADVRDFVEELDDRVEVRLSRGGGQLDSESWVLTATWTEVR